MHLTEFADADVSYGGSQYSVTDMLLSKTSDQAFIEAKEIVELIIADKHIKYPNEHRGPSRGLHQTDVLHFSVFNIGLTEPRRRASVLEFLVLHVLSEVDVIVSSKRS